MHTYQAKNTDFSLICLIAISAMSLAISGCSAEDAAGPACTLNAECSSGVCLPAGTCGLSANDGGTTADINYGPDSESSSDIASPADATTNGGSSTADGTEGSPDSVAPFSCKPDHNNAVERDEIAFAAGATANFRVAVGAEFDTTGTVANDGTRTWDLAVQLEGDTDTKLETVAVADKWYASHFPNATYAARMAAGSDLLGVFRATDTELQLQGVVSPSDGLFATRLTYDPPVAVMKFPLAPKTSWTVATTVNGLAQGVIALYTEKYVMTVDATGALKTPFGNFPVLRVHTDLARKIGLLETRSQSHIFVAECYGAVATVRSKDGQASTEFSVTSEVRRWAPAAK